MNCRKNNKYLGLNFLLLPLLMFCSFSLLGQVESSYDLSKSRYTKYKGISSKYTYNPKTGMYLYTETIEGYPINAPMVLSPKEFEAMVLAEQMKGYFQGKIAALSGNAENLSETQKNLLPEVYINSKFFQSIFSSNHASKTLFPWFIKPFDHCIWLLYNREMTALTLLC